MTENFASHARVAVVWCALTIVVPGCVQPVVASHADDVHRARIVAYTRPYAVSAALLRGMTASQAWERELSVELYKTEMFAGESVKLFHVRFTDSFHWPEYVVAEVGGVMFGLAGFPAPELAPFASRVAQTPAQQSRLDAWSATLIHVVANPDRVCIAFPMQQEYSDCTSEGLACAQAAWGTQPQPGVLQRDTVELAVSQSHARLLALVVRKATSGYLIEPSLVAFVFSDRGALEAWSQMALPVFRYSCDGLS